MTMQTSDPSVSSVPQWDDEAIDIRRYLLTLIAWWREIVLVTILAALVAIGGILFLRSQEPVLYTASTNVVLAVTSSQINLDPRIETASNPQEGITPDMRNSLLPLATDGKVVQSVIDELGSQLPEKYQEPAILVDVVEAVFPPTGPNNVIMLSAMTTDPALSALIVNTWAQKYVTHVNQLYGDVPQDTLNNVRNELDNAQEVYNAAQSALEGFIADNRLDELNRKISEKVSMRNSLANARSTAIMSIVGLQNSMDAQTYSIVAGTPFTNTLKQFEIEQSHAVARLQELLNIRVKTEIQLERARTIVNQLEEGGDAAASSLTRPLQLLKDQVFSEQPFGANQPNYLNIIPPDVNAETLYIDAVSLVTALEAYQADIEQQITEAMGWQAISPNMEALLASATVSMTANAPEADEATAAYSAALTDAYAKLFTIDDTTLQLIEQQNQVDSTEEMLYRLDGEIRTLRAALAAESSRERQLTQEHDLAWTAYDTLSNRLVELTLSRTSSNSLVRSAGPALVPVRPNPPISLLLPVAAATVAALLGMVLFVFLANSMGVQPFFSRRSPQQS